MNMKVRKILWGSMAVLSVAMSAYFVTMPDAHAQMNNPGAPGNVVAGNNLSQSGNIIGVAAPVTVANGGTGATAAGGTALDNVSGFSGTGFVQRTGAGAYSQVPTIPIASGGTNSTTATGATSNLQYLQGATGSVARSITSKFADRVSVCDFGGCAGGDVSTPFQNAVNALPSAGGTIDVPDGAYTVNTAPTWGTKSVLWNFGANATVTGSQTTFPRMLTNPTQVPVGPWIQSQSTVPSPAGGGIAAFNAEMIQPSTYNGQSVGIYAGAEGSNSAAGANVWAANTLVAALSGAGGTYQNIEADTNDYSASAIVKGISINGVGTHNPNVGLEVIRSDSTLWQRGIHVLNSQIGMQIEENTGFTNGLIIGPGPAPADTLISGTQYANGADSLLFARKTDSSPSGYFFRAVNAANSANVVTLDVNGNLALSSVTAPSLNVGGDPGASPGAVTGVQPANNDDTILFARATDTSPTGYFMRYVNAANSTNVYSFDVNGNEIATGSIASTGKIQGSNAVLTGTAQSVSAGQLSLGAGTATTATAGSVTMCSPITGYLVANLGGTAIKIPYCSN